MSQTHTWYTDPFLTALRSQGREHLSALVLSDPYEDGCWELRNVAPKSDERDKKGGLLGANAEVAYSTRPLGGFSPSMRYDLDSLCLAAPPDTRILMSGEFATGSYSLPGSLYIEARRQRGSPLVCNRQYKVVR